MRIPAVLVAVGLVASPQPAAPRRAERAVASAVVAETVMAGTVAAGTVVAGTVAPPLYESFAIALFRDAAQHGSGNLFVSPVSAGVALGMAYGGARGATRDAMGRTLGFGAMAPESVAAANARLLSSLRDQQDVQLLIANAMWAQRGVPLAPEYIADMQDDFGAEADTVDFGTQAGVDAINAWAARSTEGKIPTILSAPPDPRPVLMLANAVYFKGQWAAKFDSTMTATRGFTRLDRSVVQRRMMTRTGEYAVRVITAPERIAVLRMPYAGNRFSMFVLLPDSGAGLAGAYRALEAAPWAASRQMADMATRVHVVLPRFTVRTDLRLNDALKRLGMGAAFSDGADFSGMMAASAGARGHFAISDVRQATYIGVSEEGTEAAAVTHIGIQATSVHAGGPVQFVADHPFLAVLRDDQTGAILFIGQVTDP
jgi:serine protease inhibitor